MENNKQFTWIPFYKEIAQKLLAYRKDRTTLLSYIYSKREELQINYLHDKEGSNDLCPDIDPFTVMGIFNRGIKSENRIKITRQFATFFKVQAEVPTDFEGIPLLNNQMSHFFGFRDKRGKYDIENLWQLFEDVVMNKSIEEAYNKVIKQYIININITMALFWINPDMYMAFDSKNHIYMENEYNIKLPNYAPAYKEYMNILNDIKAKMSSGEIVENTFYEISANAFNANYETVTDSQSYSTKAKENSSQMTNQRYSYYIDLLKANHNIILNGAPGTGKTYLAKEIAKEMNATVKMVQFHPSYDYTDFVEGLRPIKDDKGNIGFERKDGVFKDFCKSAIAEPDFTFVFIIDEINRGEISKIFGELFYSIDPGYRGEKGKVQTQYQNLVEDGDVFKDGFYVPENVYIIGTMNDIDRSVESMDFAMRRRFAWQEITAEESAENMGITGDLLDRMNRLNKIIEETEGLGTSYQVGAAMFLKVKKGELTEEELWNLNLKSLMKEYLRGMPEASETLQKMEEAYFLKGQDTNQSEEDS